MTHRPPSISTPEDVDGRLRELYGDVDWTQTDSDLNQAISHLGRATEQDPDNIRAFYYHGQALRTLVERTTLSDAQRALRIYLARGAIPEIASSLHSSRRRSIGIAMPREIASSLRSSRRRSIGITMPREIASSLRSSR